MKALTTLVVFAIAILSFVLVLPGGLERHATKPPWEMKR